MLTSKRDYSIAVFEKESWKKELTFLKKIQII